MPRFQVSGGWKHWEKPQIIIKVQKIYLIVKDPRILVILFKPKKEEVIDCWKRCLHEELTSDTAWLFNSAEKDILEIEAKATEKK